MTSSFFEVSVSDLLTYGIDTKLFGQRTRCSRFLLFQPPHLRIRARPTEVVMASTGAPTWPDPTPIAQLEPSIETTNTSVSGIVTLIWPYSASQSSYSLLLVEPDFRMRRHKGQVRLHFTGSSAKAVARCGIQSGDHLLLSLDDVQWTQDAEITTQTPGKGIDWELRFGERVVLQVCKIGLV